MCHVIPTGSRLNDQRTLDFVVMTLADPLAPQTSGVVGLNPRLRFGDNTIETGDNAIAAISAADGWYRYTLSDAESDLSLIHISEPTRRHHVSRMPSSA